MAGADEEALARLIAALPVERVPVDALEAHPQNPRQGDVGKIVESIRVNGFYRVLVVQRSTSRIIAGNNSWRAAQEVRRLIAEHAGHGACATEETPDGCGWSEWEPGDLDRVDVKFLPVDDETALRVLLADNAIADEATYDEPLLASILVDVMQTRPERLVGYGFSQERVESIIAHVAPPPPPAFPDAEAVAGEATDTCPRCGYSW